MSDDTKAIANRVAALADYFSAQSGAGTDHAIGCECAKCDWADDLRHASWTIERLERDRDALAERCEKLQDAVRAFLAKYDLLEPALNNAFLMQQIHGAPYRGDNWADELAALRALAAPKDAP